MIFLEKICMPKNVEIVNFGPPVSKSWLRPLRPIGLVLTMVHSHHQMQASALIKDPGYQKSVHKTCTVYRLITAHCSSSSLTTEMNTFKRKSLFLLLNEVSLVEKKSNVIVIFILSRYIFLTRYLT